MGDRTGQPPLLAGNKKIVSLARHTYRYNCLPGWLKIKVLLVFLVGVTTVSGVVDPRSRFESSSDRRLY